MRDLRDQSIDGQRIVLHARPGRARQGLCDALMQLVGAPVLLDHALEGCHLEILRITGPLQHLVVQDGRDVLHGGSGEHLAGQVEHDHGGWEALRDGREQCLGLGLMQPVLKVL